MLNIQFVALANMHYAKGGFARRAKGQRRMADLLPCLLFQTSAGQARESTPVGVDPGVFTVELLGVGKAYNSGGQEVACHHLVVTTPAGVRVPAYRLYTDQYAICQEFNYVAGSRSNG